MSVSGKPSGKNTFFEPIWFIDTTDGFSLEIPYQILKLKGPKSPCRPMPLFLWIRKLHQTCTVSSFAPRLPAPVFIFHLMLPLFWPNGWAQPICTTLLDRLCVRIDTCMDEIILRELDSLVNQQIYQPVKSELPLPSEVNIMVKNYTTWMSVDFWIAVNLASASKNRCKSNTDRKNRTRFHKVLYQFI